MKLTKFTRNILLALFLLAAFSGCRKEEPVEKIQENEDFYAFMDYWYYWYEHIPQINPSLYPSLDKLLDAITYKPLDRWSSIALWEDIMAYYRDSKFIGHGFGSSWDGTGRLRVSFIFNSVDLYAAGVRRGWIIAAVNGVAVRQGVSINQMLGPGEIGVSNTFRFIKPDNSTVEITSAKSEVQMNTVLHQEVITLGSRKIAYLVLQGFTEPTYNELNLAFESFANQGVSDMILDLRYNGGGMVNVANHLSSMIGGDHLSDKAFVRYEYNKKRATDNNKTLLFNDDVPFNLNLNRLVTICTRFSASASELVINSLKPFMDVYIVGGNTYGKPMGSNIFGYPKDNPLYAFMPITFKTANANGVGDYFDGFPADVVAGDDLSRDFGDLDEASLKAALQLIETGIVAKVMPLSEHYILQPRDEMTGFRWEIGAH